MIKKFLIILFLVLMSVYLVIAATAFNRRSGNQICQGMELLIKDSINYGFVSKKEIEKTLKRKKLSPVGKKQDEINIRQIEEVLNEHPFIDEAECYYTPSGKIGIKVIQRIPLLRIMANNGENYYLDSKGKIMPIPENIAYVTVATGFIDRKFAQHELYELSRFINNNPFWKAQIEQIYVTPKKEFELAPRVGQHIIFLGNPGEYEERFGKLKTFYEKALNEVGWNKYSRISIEFNNQIICTKKEE